MTTPSKIIRPTTRLQGRVTLPGDKSISHRLGMLASIADGTTRIANFAASRDCRDTLKCMRGLGVSISESDDLVVIEGRGLDGLQAPVETLNAENSGTTIRLLSGILAGQPFETRITGDESLRRRPMRRVMEPLGQMGADVSASDGFPPLTIRGGRLKPITYVLPVASAQVKSCVLLAGLYADGETTVVEPIPSRDHTERMLAGFGVPVHSESGRITVKGGSRLRAPEAVCTVPGDFSSAAFFLAAALMVPGAELVLEGVGVNPTRTGFLDFLPACGADIRIENKRLETGEPVADIRVRRDRARTVRKLDVRGNIIPNVIDELPMLAVLGARLAGIEIRDAKELRVKESDRIRLTAENLRRMGVQVEEFEDGMNIEGPQVLRGATIETGGDHRMAMAFSIAALVADAPVEITDADCAGVSFPDFYKVLHALCAP